MKITDYLQKKTLLDSDLLLVDGPEGTSSITAENLASELKKRNEIKSSDQLYDWLDDIVTVEMRKNIFRGKNLGSSLTKEQAKNIVNGTFKGFFIGDYWVIEGVNYRIADINYLIIKYRSDIGTKKHHLIIIPDTYIMSDVCYHEANKLVGGYLGSTVYTKYIPQINSMIDSKFGSGNLLTYSDSLTNGCDNNGVPNSAIIVDDIKANLPTVIQLYGSNILPRIIPNDNISYQRALITNNKNQFKLFELDPLKLSINHQYLIRDIIGYEPVSSTIDPRTVSLIDSYGVLYTSYVSVANRSIRPIFGITGEAAAS